MNGRECICRRSMTFTAIDVMRLFILDGVQLTPSRITLREDARNYFIGKDSHCSDICER